MTKSEDKQRSNVNIRSPEEENRTDTKNWFKKTTLKFKTIFETTYRAYPILKTTNPESPAKRPKYSEITGLKGKKKKSFGHLGKRSHVT